MLDLKFLRENSEYIAKALKTKKFQVDISKFLEVDNRRRKAVTEVERIRAEQKSANQEMAALDKKSAIFQEKVAQLKELSNQLKNLELDLEKIEGEWNELYSSIPNIPHESVPVGRNEEDNETIYTWGDVKSVSEFSMAHFDIPGFSELIDFERGAKVTGSGFPFYIGDMARLVRGLLSFFLEEARKAGFKEYLAPLMVNESSARATGQLPDKEGQMYVVTNENLYLIPTAEVPVTNFFRDETFAEEKLPVYGCGYTPCFRREAGSWGSHVRGLNRLHQFDKVELVKWVHPTKSFEELESMREYAQSLLEKLGIPYRILAICTGDIGFSHSKQYDLEVWAGGQKRWLEVSSCSNFTDFQARRANIRFKTKSGKSDFVHTLNCSGLAIPRVLAAILENNLIKESSSDGTIRFKVKIPSVLKHWYPEEFLHIPDNE